MLSKEELDSYIAQIPPLPAVLKACKQALNAGDLTKAASLAGEDKALLGYFQNIVNKPIFGFTSDVKDPKQIFGVLGLTKARQLFQSYYTLLISPNQWEFFKLNTASFYELQASFIVRWEALLSEKNIKNEELSSLITLIPASISVCESVFKAHKEDIELIKSQKAFSYEELLYRFSGYTFFDLVKLIAKKWDFSPNVLLLLDGLSQKKYDSHEMLIYLILLINYEMSRPIAFKSGINDLFELEIDCEQEQIEFFYNVMEKVQA